MTSVALSRPWSAVDDELRRRYASFLLSHPPRTVAVGGVVWPYVVFGEGRRTVLFLHGMAGSADIWFQQLEDLAVDHRVVAVTYPDVDALEALLEGVEAVLDAVGARRITVVGSSLGGYLAQFLVGHDPGRVEAAVFANTFPPNDLVAARSAGLVRMLRLSPEPLVRRLLVRNALRRIVPAGDDSPLLAAYLHDAFVAPGIKRRFLCRYRCAVEPFATPRPEVPVLLVESSNDPLVAEDLRRMLRTAYPEAERHRFGGGGHFPYVNRAPAYTEVLRGFLAGT